MTLLTPSHPELWTLPGSSPLPPPCAPSFKNAASATTFLSPLSSFKPTANQSAHVCEGTVSDSEEGGARRVRVRGTMERRVAAWAAVLVALAACAALPATTTANKISVNWQPNTNYTVWQQTHGPFYKGDWLVFYYTAGQADVVEVNESGFNRCDATNAIYNYSKGRSFAFELNQTKTYYFICSFGYCPGGMKLAIKSQKLPPPSPPPSAQDKSAALARAHAGVALYAALAALAALLRMV
ncbi:unnamed protein product [Alopecurus aequalis]